MSVEKSKVRRIAILNSENNTCCSCRVGEDKPRCAVVFGAKFDDGLSSFVGE